MRINRTLLVLGSLDRESSRLRQIMLDNNCSVIRFSEPAHWRDCLNQNELGAALISSSVDAAISEEIRTQMQGFAPTARIIVQPPSAAI